ncbi:NACHT domain-containing protein [Actinoplanes subglobosus]|uniref:NACHT domain-containing protein n=1 Tax=Actinoplanes subglobosus TaxID=1547892 RepID=A0ABV8J7M8_9ACTN
MKWRHILQVIIGLLVVPTLVNIGTGGSGPSWLTPPRQLLWPIAVACVAAILTLEAWERRAGRDRISVRHPNDPRNVELALAQVKRYVEARQRGSLGERMRIALALDERPDAVRQPSHLVQRIGGDEFRLSADIMIADVFGRLDESMLILGVPGAGKTTQLLDLAAELVTRAGSATEPSVPVLLDLVDWETARLDSRPLRRGGGSGRESFSDWLVSSIAVRYRIPPEIGRLWLAENRFTLLLDGLDEVSAASRTRCVAEINALEGVTRIAVCSREAEYAELTARLRLQGAVVIRPLDRETVQRYLTEVSPALAGVIATLDADEELWALLTTPLMLAVMVLARVGETGPIEPEAVEPTARRGQLFDAYVVEVLARRRSGEIRDAERALRSIRMLAVACVELDTGVQVLKKFEPIDKALPRQVLDVFAFLTPFAALGAGLAWAAATAVTINGFAGLVVAVIGILFLANSNWTRMPRSPNRPLLGGVLLFYLAAPAVLAAMVVVLADQTAVSIRIVGTSFVGLIALGAFLAGLWETDSTRRSTLGEQCAVIAIGSAAVGAAYLSGSWPVLCLAWISGGILGGFLVFGVTDIDIKPRHGHRRKSLVRWPLIGYVALATPLLYFLPAQWTAPPWEVYVGILIGIGLGLMAGVMASLLGENLRVMTAVAIAGELVPWRRRFLRFAVDRSLLMRTDGEYRFIHLLIRDHLATCDPARLAKAVERRRAEV